MHHRGARDDEVPRVPAVGEVVAKGRIVRSDDRYTIYDYVRDGTTYSVTKLKPHMGTRGHHHDSVEEYYFFKEGKGKLTVGEKTYEVDAGSMGESQLTFRVPKGEFHRVENTSSGPLTFLATFVGSRDESKAVYQGRAAKTGAGASRGRSG